MAPHAQLRGQNTLAQATAPVHGSCCGSVRGLVRVILSASVPCGRRGGATWSSGGEGGGVPAVCCWSCESNQWRARRSGFGFRFRFRFRSRSSETDCCPSREETRTRRGERQQKLRAKAGGSCPWREAVASRLRAPAPLAGCGGPW